MKTAIIYYSEHHGNTLKLLGAIEKADPEAVLIDVMEADAKDMDLSGCDRIAIAPGIYCGSFAKQVISYANEHLPEEKPVFYIYTHGAPTGDFLGGIRAVAKKKKCPELGKYHCQGYDTFGPFRILGGIAKGHPTPLEVDAAVKFYKDLGKKA